jgi:myo-inositol 2-dehydrogenase / D-chiro-inositol 1-dehydrogenase
VSDQPVRLAVIGAGRMGRVHLDAMSSSSRIEPVGVVDPAPAARAAVARPGLATYASVDELLAAGGFDAVVVAAPSDLHLALVRQLADARIHMLCEKPCGVSLSEAEAVAEAIEDAGTIFQVGYWRRFVPELVALRERLHAGVLGHATLMLCHQWDAEPPPESFRRHSGGIAVDMAVHEIDQLRWLLDDDLADVHAVPAGPEREGAATDPDCAAILARTSGGCAATITLGRHFAAGDSCWIDVFGTAGYDRLTFMWGAQGDAVFRSAVARQAEAFAATLRGGPPSGAGIADALAALVVTEEINVQLDRHSASIGRGL